VSFSGSILYLLFDDKCFTGERGFQENNDHHGFQNYGMPVLTVGSAGFRPRFSELNRAAGLSETKKTRQNNNLPDFF